MARTGTEKRAAATAARGTALDKQPLKGLLPLDECPALTEVLEGPSGARLAQELARILGERLRTRTARRHVKRIARLSCIDYDEVVLLKDLSTTGVRLLVRGDQPLDIRSTLEMRLTVQLPSGRCALPVALVRVCGRDGNQIDLGCRFLSSDPERERLVDEIRSYVFGS